MTRHLPPIKALQALLGISRCFQRSTAIRMNLARTIRLRTFLIDGEAVWLN